MSKGLLQGHKIKISQIIKNAGKTTVDPLAWALLFGHHRPLENILRVWADVSKSYKGGPLQLVPHCTRWPLIQQLNNIDK